MGANGLYVWLSQSHKNAEKTTTKNERESCVKKGIKLVSTFSTKLSCTHALAKLAIMVVIGTWVKCMYTVFATFLASFILGV